MGCVPSCFPNFASWPSSLIFIPTMAVKTAQVWVLCGLVVTSSVRRTHHPHRLGPQPSLPAGRLVWLHTRPSASKSACWGCPLLPPVGLSRPLRQLPVSSLVQACFPLAGSATSLPGGISPACPWHLQLSTARMELLPSPDPLPPPRPLPGPRMPPAPHASQLGCWWPAGGRRGHDSAFWHHLRSGLLISAAGARISVCASSGRPNGEPGRSVESARCVAGAGASRGSFPSPLPEPQQFRQEALQACRRAFLRLSFPVCKMGVKSYPLEVLAGSCVWDFPQARHPVGTPPVSAWGSWTCVCSAGPRPTGRAPRGRRVGMERQAEDRGHLPIGAPSVSLPHPPGCSC